MGVRICLGCMREIEDSAARCPFCGFSLSDPHPKIALPLKTVLNDRYVIGKPVKIDGEGISYIAYDVENNHAAMIREYLPQKMVYRKADGDLEILPEYLAQFKALLSDFEELYSHIMSWKSMQHIRKVYDLFTANHTIYAVSVYEKGMTLHQFLERRGGKLSWNESRKLFDPLLAELDMVHKSGYLHRGISPDSLLMTEDGLVLIAFSICSAKVAGSEIEPSISAGYAAPEQYSVSQHGAWTDVYGICAVLYRVLTGIEPPSAQKRYPQTTLTPPSELNPSVPHLVSEAILHGLAFSSDERISSIQALRDELDGKPSTRFDQTQVHEIGAEHPYYKSAQFAHIEDEEEDEEDSSGKSQTFEREERPIWQKILIRSIPIIVIVCLILYQLMIGFPFLTFDRHAKDHESSEALSSAVSEELDEESEEAKVESNQEKSPDEDEPSQTPSVQQVEVPNFVGNSYSSFSSSNYADFAFAEPAYEYSEDYDAGIICGQSLSSGSMVKPGTKIALTVSLGSGLATVPSASTYTAEQYANLLENKYELPYEFSDEYSDTVPYGSIISISPEPGSTLDRSDGSVITIVRSIGPQ